MAALEGVMAGLYLLWWVQEKQLSPALVATILAAGDFALMGLEVPTGWLADRVGHRASLITGSTIQVVGMLWCWLGEGVPGLIAASLLVALGDAFRSGADQALLYRTCVAVDRPDDFLRIEARTSAVEQIALVVLILAGGAIVTTFGFAAGWLAEIALCAAGAGIACAMTEPPPAPPEPAAAIGAPANGGRPDWRLMTLVILPAALLGAAASAVSFLAQTAGNGEPARLTLLVASIALAEAAGSAAAVRVRATGTRHHAMLAAVGTAVLCLGLAFPPVFPIVVFALSFLAGFASPLRAAAIQQLAADGVRARAASLASACDMALSTVTLPVAGYWRARR